MMKHSKIRAQIEGLEADLAESEATRERQREILAAAAVALRGPAPDGVTYGHADIPARIDDLKRERDAWMAQAGTNQPRLVEALDDVRRLEAKVIRERERATEAVNALRALFERGPCAAEYAEAQRVLGRYF